MSVERVRFSVCIPAYNRAKYLGTLLDSILSQEFQDFEVVICEDNSKLDGVINIEDYSSQGIFDEYSITILPN